MNCKKRRDDFNKIFESTEKKSDVVIPYKLAKDISEILGFLDEVYYANDNENIVEFERNSENLYCTFSQGKYITKCKKLAEEHPNKVVILSENENGTIWCKMPTKALHLSIVTREITDEQRQEMSERLKNVRKAR